MSIRFCISVFLLTSTILSYVNSQNVIQEYFIRKDFFSGVKAGELTVYDSKEKHVYYRIQSKYALLQKLEVVALPSKKVVGRLQAKINLITYKAEFSILDSKSNRWINGIIQERLTLLTSTFDIDWNGHRITMESTMGSTVSKFRDTNGELLAQFKLRLLSIFWTKKYDMQIFSDKFPEQIYLLALAAHDHMRSRNKG